MRVLRSSCAILVSLAWATAHAQCLTPNSEIFGTPQFDGAPGTINALLAFDGSLYAAGQFSRAGGLNAENIARWDGVHWNPVGGGVPGVVRDLIIAPGPGGALSLHAAGRCVTGDFTSSPLSRWDGVRWIPDSRLIGDALDAQMYPSANGSLYLAGALAIANGVSPPTPSTFVRLGASVDSIGVMGSVMRLTSIRFNNAEHLVAAGAFENVAGVPAQDIARFNGTTWTGFPTLPSSFRFTQVAALGKLPVSGTSSPVDQLWASGFVTGTYIWTPNATTGSWQVAPGTTGSGLGPSLLFADTRQPLAPRMIAAGPNFNFTNAHDVATLDGSLWTGLTPFAFDSFTQNINAITPYSPTPAPVPPLILAGTFDGLWQTPGAATFEPVQRFNSIARFDGSSVTPLSSDGMPGVTSCGVRAIAYNPGSDQLLAVGEFTRRDDQPMSNAIARWSDAQWSSSGTDIVGTPTRAVPFADGFAISGYFTVRGNPAITYTAFVSQDGAVTSTGLPAITGNSSLVSGVINGVERLFANSSNTIREWSPAGWNALPAIAGTLRGMAVAPDVVAGSGNTLYALGLNIGTGSRPIVRLVDNAWQVVGDTSMPANSSVSSVLVATTPAGPRLHAFGTFIVAGSYYSVAILQPNGSWTFSALGQSPQVRQAASLQINGEPSVIAVGEFARYEQMSGTRYFYLARLGPEAWEPFGPSINGPVMSLKVIDNNQSPRIIVAGDFTRVDQTNVRGFATLVPCPSCIADVDASGGVDATDLAIFMNHYERGEDPADIDVSGGVDAGDLATFFAAFESGC